MENKKQGYKVRKYQGPVKRYCQMLNLKNDAALIAEYRKRHSEGKVWPETLAAIREVGILEMEIYILGTNLFMIVETPLDFDWDTAMARMATLPRQAEWEEYMSVFQQAEPGASSAEKWQLKILAINNKINSIKKNKQNCTKPKKKLRQLHSITQLI